MSVEDDVARVQAVTSRLAGPTKVWVLLLDGQSGHTISVYASEAVGRDAWIECLKANYAGHEDLHHAIAEIETGCNSMEFPAETFWDFREYEVNS